MPRTTKNVAMRWTIMDLRSSFSRPNFGQIRVSKIPRKNITMGSAESEAADAKATVGARIRPAR